MNRGYKVCVEEDGKLWSYSKHFDPVKVIKYEDQEGV